MRGMRLKGSDREFNLKHGAADLVSVFTFVALTLVIVRQLSGMPESFASITSISALVALVHIAVHTAATRYRSSWRFFSVHDAISCAGSALFAALVVALLWFDSVPLSGWALVLGAAALSVMAPRILVRVLDSHDFLGFRARRSVQAEITPFEAGAQKILLLVGYGERCVDFIRSQERTGDAYDIAGLVHIDRSCETASLRGVPVLGRIDDIKDIVDALSAAGRRPDMLVLTRDEMSRRSVGEVLSLTDKVGINVAWLPRSNHLDQRDAQALRAIQLDDLLPRSANLFDSQSCAELLSGSTVLVTGAGGSIGSELVRQIAGLSPARLVLTDVSEHALYLIDQEISRRFGDIAIASMLLDVRDRDAVLRAMQTHSPDFVFHAAALKHVPIVEAQPSEGVVTNVIGSRNVADMAAEAGARAMVMVSTDKAVNPANVMGATKRLAEAYCQAMDAAPVEVKGKTRFVTVRFGNVLGSNGSVVPLFQRQLAHGGPLTVTHPDVERFFMTIPEASRLILQALLLGVEDADGEQGIFVLDMGKPVKIVDLARQVIRLSGLKPEIDVKIVYTGLRPGEKLYEELMHDAEDLLPTEHPSLMVARPRFVQIQTVRSQIEVIKTAAETGDTDEVIRLLNLYIPEFEAMAREARSHRSTEEPASRPEAV